MSNKKVKDLDELVLKTKSTGQSLFNKNRLLDIDIENLRTIKSVKSDQNTQE